MSIVFSRPLGDQFNVEHFLGNCLGIEEQGDWLLSHGIEFFNLAQRIRDAENANKGVTGEPTIDHQNNRDRKFRDDKSRSALRSQILSELINQDRLDDDDQIKLGPGGGGAKPKGMDEPVAGKQAYFIVGLPASGKSSLVTQTADQLGAMIIDSDFAKRKLPEYNGSFAGANLVHKESSLVILGGTKAPSLLGYCKAAGFNMVIPTVGSDFEDIVATAKALKESGYSVHLSATILHRKEAAIRAASRFLKTERYVPLGLIFDGYANDPVMHYYRERSLYQPGGFWSSMGSICTDVVNGKVEFTDSANPVYLRMKGV
ncbi:MAG: zeta toxin family protein [Pseudomonadota bacterium]